MSNLPGSIADHNQRSYQARLDKEDAEVIEPKYPVNKSKGRPHMLKNDRNVADQLLADAINDTGCNYNGVYYD